VYGRGIGSTLAVTLLKKWRDDPSVITLEPSRLKEWPHDWGKRLGELEFGIMSDGSGI